MKILVVEDNAVTATLMAGVLTRHGYTVVLARNGNDALCLLGSHPDIQGVITDIMMPESSGLDLLRVLRESPAWQNLPTIVTTARDDEATVGKAAAFGCKDYILKPVKPARLVERVAKVFGGDKVILMSPPEVINRYSLNLETYRAMAKNLAIQVDKAIGGFPNGSVNGTPSLQEDFIQMMESATILGAERLMAALENAFPSPASPPLTPLLGARLLEQLQLVRNALRSVID